MKLRELQVKAFSSIPSIAAANVLPGQNFCDAFTTRAPEKLLAIEAARKIMSSAPNWVHQLIAVRNTLVRLVGLKGEAPVQVHTAERLGMFPVVSSTPDCVILGFDDKHLDFRIVIETKPTSNTQTDVSLATAVKWHNIWGRLYLAFVLPFHKVIVRSMLGRL